MKPVVKYSIIAVALLLVIGGIILTNLASHGLILVNEEGFEIDSKHLENNEPTLVISISGSERRIEIKEGIERSIPYSEENLSSLKKDIEDGTVILVQASEDTDAVLLVETIDQLKKQGFNARVETTN